MIAGPITLFKIIITSHSSSPAKATTRDLWPHAKQMLARTSTQSPIKHLASHTSKKKEACKNVHPPSASGSIPTSHIDTACLKPQGFVWSSLHRSGRDHHSWRHCMHRWAPLCSPALPAKASLGSPCWCSTGYWEWSQHGLAHSKAASCRSRSQEASCWTCQKWKTQSRKY